MDPSEASPLLTIASLAIAFGGPLSLFCYYLYSKPHLIALFLVSALSSLCGIIVTAIIWMILRSQVPIGVFSVFGSFIQECSRFCLIRYIYRRVEVAYSKSTLGAATKGRSRGSFKLDDMTSSLGAGIGFGLMKELLIYGNIIAKHIHSASEDLKFFEKTFFFQYPLPDVLGIAIVAALFFFLDLILMPIAFYAEKNRNTIIFSIIFLLRISASSLMFLNQTVGGFYYIVLGIFCIILFACFVFLRLLFSSRQ